MAPASSHLDTEHARDIAQLGAAVAQTQMKVSEVEHDLGREIDELFTRLHSLEEKVKRFLHSQPPTRAERHAEQARRVRERARQVNGRMG